MVFAWWSPKHSLAVYDLLSEDASDASGSHLDVLTDWEQLQDVWIIQQGQQLLRRSHELLRSSSSRHTLDFSIFLADGEWRMECVPCLSSLPSFWACWCLPWKMCARPEPEKWPHFSWASLLSLNLSPNLCSNILQRGYELPAVTVGMFPQRALSLYLC